MDFILRQGTVEDSAAVAELAALTFPDACPPQLGEQDIGAFIEGNLSPHHFDMYLSDSRYIVQLAASVAGDLLGYSLSDTRAPAPASIPQPAGYISKFYVVRKTRGTGLAQELMQLTLSALQARGLRAAHLGTSTENTASNAFYRKCGFRPAGFREFSVGNTVCTDNLWFYTLENLPAQ